MNDLISRQAAIDALHMHLMYRMGTDSNKKRLDEWINNLPSVQPERHKGWWIPQNNNKVNGMTSTAVYYYPKCSVCGHCANYTNFCPNCGADMRGEQDD